MAKGSADLLLPQKLAKGKADGDVLKSQEMYVFGTTLMGLIVLSCYWNDFRNFTCELGLSFPLRPS